MYISSFVLTGRITLTSNRLSLRCRVLSKQFLFLFLGDQPIIVYIIKDFVRDWDFWMFLIPIIEEVLFIKCWLGWRIFPFLQVRRITSSYCVLIVIVFRNVFFILSFEFFRGFLERCLPIVIPLRVLLNLLISFFSSHLGVGQTFDNVLFSLFDDHAHPFVDETECMVVVADVLRRQIIDVPFNVI